MTNLIEFEDLYTTVARSRVRLAIDRVLRSRPESERDEVEQDTWLQIWKSLDKFRGESAPTTWAFKVAINHSLMYLRKWRREHSAWVDHIGVHESTGDEGSMFDSLIADIDERPDLAIDIERILARLAPGYRDAIIDHDLLGLEHGESATRRGHSLGTSKSQLHKARQKFQNFYKKRKNPMFVSVDTMSI